MRSLAPTLIHIVCHGRPGIEVFTVSPDGEPVTTFEGLRVGADVAAGVGRGMVLEGPP